MASLGILEAPRLGHLLCHRGFLSPANLERTLAERGGGTLEPLGASLRHRGLVSDVDLTAAIRKQRQLRERVLRHVRCLPRLGVILRRRGLVDESDLAAALDEQSHSWEALGDILLRRGKLRPADLESALHDQRALHDRVHDALAKVPRLGEMLCHRGLVTEAQVAEALRGHRPGEWLGQALVHRGLLGAHDLVDMLVEQHRLRNLALVALTGAMLTVQPLTAIASDLGETSTEAVQISLTIPQRVQVVGHQGAQDVVQIVGAAATSDLVPVASLTPLSGPAHIEIRGSGPDGALVASTADSTLLPYHVDLHDPLTGQFTRLDCGSNAEMNAVPSMIEIGFDGLLPAETGTVTAGGTLLVMVSSQI